MIPEAALFAFGALTLMFAVVVTFDPRMLWDLADELGAPRRSGRCRAPPPIARRPPSARQAGPPAPADVHSAADARVQHRTAALAAGLPPAPRQG